MLYSVVAWLHVGALVVGVGGAAFVLLVLRPLALRTLEPQVAQRLMGVVGLRFRWFNWGAIVVFIVTGLWLATAYRHITTADALFQTNFGKSLFIKSVLALALFAGALSVTLPGQKLAWFRKRQPTVIAINLVLAAVIVLIASAMVRQGGIF